MIDNKKKSNLNGENLLQGSFKLLSLCEWSLNCNKKCLKGISFIVKRTEKGLNYVMYVLK